MGGFKETPVGVPAWLEPFILRLFNVLNVSCRVLGLSGTALAGSSPEFQTSEMRDIMMLKAARRQLVT